MVLQNKGKSAAENLKYDSFWVLVRIKQTNNKEVTLILCENNHEHKEKRKEKKTEVTAKKVTSQVGKDGEGDGTILEVELAPKSTDG